MQLTLEVAHRNQAAVLVQLVFSRLPSDAFLVYTQQTQEASALSALRSLLDETDLTSGKQVMRGVATDVLMSQLLDPS